MRRLLKRNFMRERWRKQSGKWGRETETMTPVKCLQTTWLGLFWRDSEWASSPMEDGWCLGWKFLNQTLNSELFCVSRTQQPLQGACPTVQIVKSCLATLTIRFCCATVRAYLGLMGSHVRTPGMCVHVSGIQNSPLLGLGLSSQWAETTEDIVWWGRIHQAVAARMCVCRNVWSLATGCTSTQCVCVSVCVHVLVRGPTTVMWIPAANGRDKWSKVLLVSCLILEPNTC